MKVIGGLALSVGIVLFIIYLGAWAALVREHGSATAVRFAFTLWPGNVIQFAVLATSILLVFGGAVLLTKQE